MKNFFLLFPIPPILYIVLGWLFCEIWWGGDPSTGFFALIYTFITGLAFYTIEIVVFFALRFLTKKLLSVSQVSLIVIGIVFTALILLGGFNGLILKVVSLTKNVNLCNLIQPSLYFLTSFSREGWQDWRENNVVKNACIMDIAAETKEESLCETFPPEEKDGCYNNLAFENEDPTFCEKIKGGTFYSRGWCYLNLASKTRKIIYCEKVGEITEEECLADSHYVGYSRQCPDLNPEEKSECCKMDGEAMKEDCIESII